MSFLSEKKRILKSEIKVLQEGYDGMERRFALGNISDAIFDKHEPILKIQIEAKTKQFLNLPSKKGSRPKVVE